MCVTVCIFIGSFPTKLLPQAWEPFWLHVQGMREKGWVRRKGGCDSFPSRLTLKDNMRCLSTDSGACPPHHQVGASEPS